MPLLRCPARPISSGGMIRPACFIGLDALPSHPRISFVTSLDYPVSLAPLKATRFRWVLGLFLFLLTFLSYMDRVNLGVVTEQIMAEFNFTRIDMGILQSCFFIGYAAMQIPAGILAGVFKPNVVITTAVTSWSLFTIMTTRCSSFFSFAGVRALFGVGEGPIFPASITLVGRWFNKTERARASSLLVAGGFFGPVVGSGLTVAIMAALGWRAVFIIYGVAGLLIAVVWHTLATASPNDSQFVNEAEVAQIEGAINTGTVTTTKVAPWSKFLRCPQFWAIGIQFFITDYIMYVYLAWLPSYLLEAQKFSLSKMGVAASLPWAALVAALLASGWFSDRLVAAGACKRNARTYLAAPGLVLCSIFLYLASMAAIPALNVLWLTLSLGSLGLAFTGSWGACHDLGGHYVGSVAGWMNFWGNLGGVSAPIVTASIASAYGWHAAILATSGLALIGVAVWFLVKPDMPLPLSHSVKP